MPSFIKENFIYLLIAIFMFGYIGFGLFLFSTSKENKKRRTIAGTLLFGGLWLLLNKDANRDLTKTEIFGFIIIFIFLVGAVLFNNY